MTTLANNLALDACLNYIAAGSIQLCICQTEPLTLADCTTLSGSGGKRVSTEMDITGQVPLSYGATANSRKLTVPSKNFTDGVLVGVAEVGADLWLAVYDGARLLLRTDGITNRELIQGSTVITPAFEFGIAQ